MCVYRRRQITFLCDESVCVCVWNCWREKGGRNAKVGQLSFRVEKLKELELWSEYIRSLMRGDGLRNGIIYLTWLAHWRKLGAKWSDKVLSSSGDWECRNLASSLSCIIQIKPCMEISLSRNYYELGMCWMTVMLGFGRVEEDLSRRKRPKERKNLLPLETSLCVMFMLAFLRDFLPLKKWVKGDGSGIKSYETTWKTLNVHFAYYI